jgi:hypothetical protein
MIKERTRMAEESIYQGPEIELLPHASRTMQQLDRPPSLASLVEGE